jgi:hypothetical protein
MAFTYFLSSTDSDIQVVSRIRLGIGDHKKAAGPQPDATNYQDDEILQIYADEGNDENRAMARLLEILATLWAGAPKTMFGSLIDPTRISRDYAMRAEKLRTQYGYGQGATGGFSVQMTNPEPS